MRHSHPLLIAALVGVVVPALVGGRPAIANPIGGPPEQRAAGDSLESRHSALDDRAHVLRADAGTLREALRGLDVELEARAQQVVAAVAARDQALAAVDGAREVLSTASREVAVARSRLKRVAAESYISGPAAANLLLSSRDVNEVARRQVMAAAAADARVRVVRALAAAERRAVAAEAAARAALEASERAATAAREEMARYEEQRARQLDVLRLVEERLERTLAEAAALAAIDRDLAAEVSGKDAALTDAVAGVALPPLPPLPPTPAIPTTVVGRIRIATSVADGLRRLLAAAADAGIELSGGGYRDPAAQLALRQWNCGTTEYDLYERPASECAPPTARPGTSMHERGLAVDFTVGGKPIISETDAAFVWLAANAPSFGFFNLPGEPWHWSTTGS